jgi:hypothetical protein
MSPCNLICQNRPKRICGTNYKFKQTDCPHNSAVHATRASLLYYWAPQLQDTISLQRQWLEPTPPTPTAPSPGPSARMSMQHLRINASYLALSTPTTAKTPTVSKLDPIGPSVRILAFWLVYPLKPVIPDTSRDPFFSSPSPFLPWLFSPSSNSPFSYLNTLHAEQRGLLRKTKWERNKGEFGVKEGWWIGWVIWMK